MITLKSHGKKVIDINEESIRKILNIYPDEHLASRSVFVNAFTTSELSYTDLHAECDKILIPWQLFLLEPTKLDGAIKKIDSKRKVKFDQRLIASRDNEGRGVSLRIADRLIALQDFARSGVSEDNQFCGSLKRLDRNNWAASIMDHFDIEASMLESGKKEKTLEYLIHRMEERNIRVARGVLTNKLLPAENTMRSTYRKSSGFVVRDEKVPYMFLPSEINNNETPGRQILTLLVLSVLIGLDKYDTYITGDLELHVKNDKALQQAFGVANEILLPFSVTDKYAGVRITEAIRDDLASRFMLTPSAVVVTLRHRGLIDEPSQSALLDSIAVDQNGKNFHPRTPNLDTSVRKLCGNTTCNDIIRAIASGTLKSVEAQYLMFGRVDKLKFVKFKASVGL